MSDARVPVDEYFSAFGLPATVTRPNLDPITGTAIVWISPLTISSPEGAALQGASPQRLLVVRRDQVPTLPGGTVIEAPEAETGELLEWKVDSVVAIELELIRALVLPNA